ncbi:MAG: HAMP domain-containing sensor histidine kinase [Pseudomonadota bacterium]
MRGVAHDINGLMARASLVAEQLRLYNDARVKDRAELIVQAIDRVAEICRLELSQYLREKDEVVQQSTCIDKLLRQITNLVSVECLLGENQIMFHNSIDEDLRFYCHSPSLFRILFNLTLNAANAINKSGGSWIEIAASQHCGRVYFDISDDGPGLPDHVLAYLYPRMNDAMAPQGPIGSGLLTSVTLARELRGSLNLVKSTSSGTSFCLTLPEKPPKDVQAREANLVNMRAVN